jgi:hypothetical protein
MAHNLAQFITPTISDKIDKIDKIKTEQDKVEILLKSNPTREILDDAMERHREKRDQAIANATSPGNAKVTQVQYRITFEDFKAMVRQQLTVSAEQQRVYATEANQKSSQWLEVKERRLTSSQFGSAAEHNTYQTMMQLLVSKLWPKPFNNKFMAYGSKYEAVANYVFQKFMRCNARTLLQLRKVDPRTHVMSPTEALERFKPDAPTLDAFRQYESSSVKMHALKQSDLITKVSEPMTVPYDSASTPVTALQVVVSRTPGEEFLGFSPDGVIVENGNYGGLEIKCPSSTKKIPNYIPHAHYDQMQGTMYISGFTFYYYVVYTPEYTLIRKLTYDKHYCETMLVPCFHNFFKHYVRALYYKHCGLLKEGEISPAVTL